MKKILSLRIYNVNPRTPRKKEVEFYIAENYQRLIQEKIYSTLL